MMITIVVTAIPLVSSVKVVALIVIVQHVYQESTCIMDNVLKVVLMVPLVMTLPKSV